VAVATASGVVDTDAILADEKVVDMQNRFRLLDTDVAQFMTILNKLPSQEAIREKVNWLEDQYFPNLTTLAASATSAASSISVATDTGAYFKVGDQVRFSNSGEIAEVTGVTTDSVGLTRSIGTVAANTAQTGVEILIVGNASAQGADYGTLKVTTRVLGYNYTQITRTPFGFTGTQTVIETYGPGDPANEISKKAVEHKRFLENSCWVGGRAYDSTNSKGWMGGIVHEFLSTNVTNAVGTLSLTALDNALTSILQHGTMNKVIFAAPKPARGLSQLMGADWVQTRETTDVYGVKVNTFIDGAYGARLPVITMRDWGNETTSGLGRGGWIVVLDLAYIKKRPLRDRNTRLLRNRQGNGVDSVIHEYLTEMSLEVAQEKCHGLLTGVTG
jgi:hypothetical protein